jgi:Secretion system C-terminal sorting domain
MKNGQNTKFVYVYSDFRSNPNLSCIQVDNAAYSNANWLGIKDATASYNTICNTLSIDQAVYATMTLYPNPSKDIVNLTGLSQGDKIVITDFSGKTILTKIVNQENEVISTASFTAGLYIVSVGEKTRLKLVKE